MVHDGDLVLEVLDLVVHELEPALHLLDHILRMLVQHTGEERAHASSKLKKCSGQITGGNILFHSGLAESELFCWISP